MLFHALHLLFRAQHTIALASLGAVQHHLFFPVELWGLSLKAISPIDIFLPINTELALPSRKNLCDPYMLLVTQKPKPPLGT